MKRSLILLLVGLLMLGGIIFGSRFYGQRRDARAAFRGTLYSNYKYRKYPARILALADKIQKTDYLARRAEEEEWLDTLADASRKLEEAREAGRRGNKIYLGLRDGTFLSGRAVDMTTELGRLARLIRTNRTEARAAVRRIENEVDRAVYYVERRTDVLKKARREVAQINAALGPDLHREIQAAGRQYPENAGAFRRRVRDLRQMQSRSAASLAALKQEAAKSPAELDMNRMTLRSNDIRQRHGSVLGGAQSLRQDARDFPYAVTRIMTDARAHVVKSRLVYQLQLREWRVGPRGRMSSRSYWKTMERFKLHPRLSHLGMSVYFKPARRLHRYATGSVAPSGYRFVALVAGAYGAWGGKGPQSRFRFYPHFRGLAKLFLARGLTRTDYNQFYMARTDNRRVYYGSGRFGTTGTLTQRAYRRANLLKPGMFARLKAMTKPPRPYGSSSHRGYSGGSGK